MNWVAIRETESRPALILGTSSDRIGTPSGQSYYATASKSLVREIGLPIAPYAGIAYGTWEDELNLIGGVNAHFARGWSGMLIFDGVHLHEMVTWTWRRHVFGFLLVRGHDPGVSYSVTF